MPGVMPVVPGEGAAEGVAEAGVDEGAAQSLLPLCALCSLHHPCCVKQWLLLLLSDSGVEE